ncbi:hypothetical protein M758_11G079500 [Ceratodon purpureus]|uniref:TPD1 protein homolog 1-like n=1 Tax=Ceratodon purpureus TaxID=3225 RepID=A0A8T0GCU7_CERPU|nr:hypothetical protein KC19_11G082100 [Ceratodon purpureus]KAG0601041.1 hypothetical protein M758_11G079500 [Ceratodon purpureus]
MAAMATRRSRLMIHIWLCCSLSVLCACEVMYASVGGRESNMELETGGEYYGKLHPMNRKLRASTPMCSKADISITQGRSGNRNGIPAFSVQITNLCMNRNCQLQNIHVACAAFASARPLDSRVFQRIKFNDCLVMGGAPLRAGGSVAFEYANSSEYPLRVVSADLGQCA